MPSHSAAETVDDAPTNSAVSVVGTGVWLGARPDAIFAISWVVSWGCNVTKAHVAMLLLLLSRREQAQVAPGPCAGGRRYLSPIPAADLGGPHLLCFGNIHLRHATLVTVHALIRPRRLLRSSILIQQSCYTPAPPALVKCLFLPNHSHQPQFPRFSTALPR
jgi:hypothetical protein